MNRNSAFMPAVILASWPGRCSAGDGGRVIRCIVGTAPLTADMRQFIEACFDVDLHDGYGLTEIGGVARNGIIARPPVIDYKLVDVPELGYFTTDRPHPRGELLVKSHIAMPGYFKRPDLTAKVFDADGYYRTGDVMAETAPEHLVFVDRRNNVLKLSQGEFVATSRLAPADRAGRARTAVTVACGSPCRRARCGCCGRWPIP